MVHLKYMHIIKAQKAFDIFLRKDRTLVHVLRSSIMTTYSAKVREYCLSVLHSFFHSEGQPMKKK